ncbi:MAG: hypothetical protein QOE99_2774 [Actinomycetota bacterium]|jgi:xanthine/uracil/vitamin C permease (AzgA family)|nr:hypothetical protein [Actinomycetota bacterium]
MRTVPRSVAVPFLLALTGVLLMVGLVIARAAGAVAVGVYLVLVVAAVVAGGVAARRRLRIAALSAGRTCTCCTSTVHDPVKVI